MEIIVEIIAGLLQFIFQAAWELVLQTVLQLLFEAGLHVAKGLFDSAREYSAWAAAIGYILIGAIAGWISLLFFPILFVTSMGFRLANLLLMPLICGALMSLIGSWRESRGLSRIRMETFAYGALFSFVFSLTRLIGAQA